jgi:hypothetical protein
MPHKRRTADRAATRRRSGRRCPARLGCGRQAPHSPTS